MNNQSTIKQTIIGTGLNGLVGSKFVQLFGNQYQFDSLDLRHPTNPLDITDENAVNQAVSESSAKVVVHLAAFTNVSAAWEQRADKTGLVYQVNVNGTKNIIRACEVYGKYLIHISTSYVFDGTNDNLYLETDTPKPIEWYGETKWLAEEAIINSKLDWSILRIDQPFRSDPFEKIDLAHQIINGLKNNSLKPLFNNHFFGPTFIDDFAKIIDYFIKHQPQGIYHATSGEKWTDYDFGQLIKNTHNLSGQIKVGDLNQYLQSLDRPYQRNTALNNQKISSLLDFKLHTIKEAVKQIIC